MGRVFVLRHGRSLANERGVIASRPTNARDAFGLTSRGRDQVLRSIARARSRNALVPPLVLISSPLLRARESADAAAELLGVTPSVDERLTERDFGDFELGSDRLYARVWEQDLRDPTHRLWGVESVAHVLRRAGALVAESSRPEEAPTLVLCTHGDVASTLLCAASGAPLGRHRQVGALRTGALATLRATEPVLEALRTLDVTGVG
ncbi:MAG: histidine phosphatase family protein [Gemmatimonadetes bacterium]|nr:histidine phosphatase family protein [Gemmatimonadota bacterium]